MKTFNQYTNKVELEEGLYDPGIFHAVFMAGGPGSGKSFIVGKTSLVSLGLRLINSDTIFERSLAKAGMKTTPEDIFSDKGQAIRGTAKALTTKKQEIVLKGRLGIIVDGTGKEYDRIKNQKVALDVLGYDSMMIFVNTNLETAQERNKMRSRQLATDMVAKSWQDVQDNIGKFQHLFGRKNFLVVDNSQNVNVDKTTLAAYKKIVRWLNKKPENHIYQKWVDREKESRGITK